MRMRQLESQAIATPQRDAELGALRKATSGLLIRYAPDLLQGFLLYVSEYLPLLRALTPMVGRVNQVLEAANLPREPQVVQSESKPVA